jgi:hypothetical protein
VGLKATPSPGSVELTWREAEEAAQVRYHVYRARSDAGEFTRITNEPTHSPTYTDTTASDGTQYRYTVRAVSRRGVESASAPAATAATLPEVRAPLFVADFQQQTDAALYGGGTARGAVHGKARAAGTALDLRQGGHVTFEHRSAFDLSRRLSLECWVQFTKEAQMPVVVSCGHWQQAGWFLQRIGAGWRWHVGGIDCDGGAPAPGRWTHLVGSYDGKTARLFQDGRLVAEKAGSAIRRPWKGALHVGQYSGGPGAPYQVNGWIAGVKIYGRVLAARDVKAASEKKPAGP